MCYVCLKDDLFNNAEAFGQRYGKAIPGSNGRLRAKAIYLKEAIKVLESEIDPRCDDGEKSLQQLKDEQYRLSREL